MSLLPPSPHLLLLLLLLRLLSSVPSSLCRSPPPIDRFVEDVKLLVDLTQNTTVGFACPVRDSFMGVTDRYNSHFVTRKVTYYVDVDAELDNYVAVTKFRNDHLGPYHCLYRANHETEAYAFVLSEMPNHDEYGHIHMESEGDSLAVSCPLEKDDGDEHVWERLNERTGLFDWLSDGTHLVTNNVGKHIGLTTIRCCAKRRPIIAWYQRLMRTFGLIGRYMRSTNYSSIIQPVPMHIGSVVNLYCIGGNYEIKEDGADTRFYIRRNETIIDPIVAFPEGIKKKMSLRTIIIIVSKYRPEYEGVYVCEKDGVRQTITLATHYGYPVLSKYGRQQLKPNGASESLMCESTVPKSGSFVSFVVKRQGESPLRLKAGDAVEGFAVKATDSGRLYLKFKATDEMENAEVECWVKDEKTSVKYIRN